MGVYMKCIQKKITAGVIGLSVILFSFSDSECHSGKKNYMNEELWKSKTSEQVLTKETKMYNIRCFESKLSALGWFQYRKLTKQEREEAMKLADGSSYTPDVAVFLVGHEI